MRTWNDYKDHVKKVDPETGKDMEEAEEMAAIISAMIEQRQTLGLSQRVGSSLRNAAIVYCEN